MRADKDPPWGLDGGKPGAINETTLIRADGSERKLKKATGVAMQAGDRLIFSTAGGGGCGDPHSRDQQSVAADVRAGYVSQEQRYATMDFLSKRIKRRNSHEITRATATGAAG